MTRLIRMGSLLSTSGSLALVLAGNALAEPNPSAGFGQHVAMCAQGASASAKAHRVSPVPTTA